MKTLTLRIKDTEFAVPIRDETPCRQALVGMANFDYCNLLFIATPQSGKYCYYVTVYFVINSKGVNIS